MLIVRTLAKPLTFNLKYLRILEANRSFTIYYFSAVLLLISSLLLYKNFWQKRRFIMKSFVISLVGFFW